jgi:hypothetical protein
MCGAAFERSVGRHEAPLRRPGCWLRVFHLPLQQLQDHPPATHSPPHPTPPLPPPPGRTDPSSEPGRWQTTYVTTDFNQTQAEWVDVDMEMEARLNGAYDKVRPALPALLLALAGAAGAAGAGAGCQAVQQRGSPAAPLRLLTRLPLPLRLPLRARPQVKALLARNRACLDALVELLLEKEQVQGEEVRALVEAQGHPDDLAFRAQAKEAALL